MWNRFKDNTVQFPDGMDKEVKGEGSGQDKILMSRPGEKELRYQELSDIDLSLLDSTTFGEGIQKIQLEGIVGTKIIEIPDGNVINGLIVATVEPQIGTFGEFSIELEEGINILDLYDIGPFYTIEVPELCDILIKLERDGMVD